MLFRILTSRSEWKANKFTTVCSAFAPSWGGGTGYQQFAAKAWGVSWDVVTGRNRDLKKSQSKRWNGGESHLQIGRAHV